MFAAIAGGVLLVGGATLVARVYLYKPGKLGEPCGRDPARACDEGLLCVPEARKCLLVGGAPCQQATLCASGECESKKGVCAIPLGGTCTFRDKKAAPCPKRSTCDPTTKTCVVNVPECQAGAQQCTPDGTGIRSCNDDGNWKTDWCPTSAPLCRDARCRQCAADYGKTCNYGGTVQCDGTCRGVEAPTTFGQAFVANFNNGTGGNLGVYTSVPLNGGSAPTFNLGSSNGLSAPIAVRMDPGGKKIWVVDYGNRKVFAFDLPLTSNSMPMTTLTASAYPTDLRFDANGNLWVGEPAIGKIEEWTGPNPTGAPAKTLTAGSGSENVFSLAFDSNGVLYAGCTGTPMLYVFNTPASQTTASLTNANYGDSISGLAFNGGKLYVSSFGGAVGYFTTPITATSTPKNITKVLYGWNPSFSPQGELIVPGSAVNKVNFYSAPSFGSVAFTLQTNLLDPRSVEFSP